MSSEIVLEEQAVETILDVQSVQSSDEPPMEEWSSIVLAVPEEKQKVIDFRDGLYQPGSGEVCAKYIAMSDSSVLRHPYYSYPAVVDPGIKKALLQPAEKIIYADDGQELYLALCKEMNQCPIGIFRRGLLENIINLKYYGVNPVGVRAMAKALQFNRFVIVLNLTDNFLSIDACFHLGEMLTSNSTLQELNLSGCRIGPEGMEQLCAGLLVNRGLRILNLDKNKLGDEGGEHLAAAVFKGIDVQQISLSYNNIGSKCTNAFAEAFETHNQLTHINLSWNNLFQPLGTCNMLNRLEENKSLLELNLAWNSLSGPRIANAIKNAMKAPNLRLLDLSNNKFSSDAIPNLIANMTKAKKMLTFNLSFNPMTAEDSLKILTKMKMGACKVQNLFMDNVFVNQEFIETLDKMKAMKSKKNAVVTHGIVVGGFKAMGPDMRDLVLDRADYLGNKPKKNKVDVGLLILQVFKNSGFTEMMDSKDFYTQLKMAGAPADNDLIDEMTNVFPGPRTKKAKMINLKLLVEYIKRKWPDRKLLPTPPPEPEPLPLTKNDKGKDKGKGKVKK